MTLREYQQKLFSMIIDFVQFCNKEGLTYYAVGGTALGAVRHNGFIPWDDDVDICLPREDYEKMIDLIPKKLPKYKLYFLENAQIYLLLDKSVPLRMTSDNFTLGKGTDFYACIDLFPMDGAPNNRLMRMLRMDRIILNRMFLKFCYIQQCYESARRPKWENYILRIAKKLHTERFLKPGFFNKRWANLATKNSYENSDWCMIAYGSYKHGDVMEKKGVEPGKMIPFETSSVCVFADYNTYLTQLYGDYMTPYRQEDAAHGVFEEERQ